MISSTELACIQCAAVSTNLNIITSYLYLCKVKNLLDLSLMRFPPHLFVTNFPFLLCLMMIKAAQGNSPSSACLPPTTLVCMTIEDLLWSWRPHSHPTLSTWSTCEEKLRSRMTASFERSSFTIIDTITPQYLESWGHTFRAIGCSVY